MRVVGHLRTFNKQRNVLAFNIRPIEDFNEVSHHLAQVIYGHLDATKGVPVVSEMVVQIVSTWTNAGSICRMQLVYWKLSWQPIITFTLYSTHTLNHTCTCYTCDRHTYIHTRIYTAPSVPTGNIQY